MVSKLVPGGLFGSIGLNRHSTPTGPETTPEELAQIYKREDFDGTPWPTESPVSGVYDVKYTSTKLILLNNNLGKRYSRLRGYGVSRTDRKVDPERHFRVNSPERMYHHLRCYDSNWELLPENMRSEVQSSFLNDTLEEKLLGLQVTYRTLIPPHLRPQESFYMEYLRRLKNEQKDKLPNIYDKRLRDYEDTYVKRAKLAGITLRNEEEKQEAIQTTKQTSSMPSSRTSPCTPFFCDSSYSEIEEYSSSEMILNEMITDYANLGTPNVLRGKEGRERPKSRLGRDPSRPATSLGGILNINSSPLATSGKLLQDISEMAEERTEK